MVAANLWFDSFRICQNLFELVGACCYLLGLVTNKLELLVRLELLVMLEHQ